MMLHMPLMVCATPKLEDIVCTMNDIDDSKALFWLTYQPKPYNHTAYLRLVIYFFRPPFLHVSGQVHENAVSRAAFGLKCLGH